MSVENEQTDTKQDGRTCLAKPISQARTGTRKLFPAQLTMNRMGKLTRLVCNMQYCDDHTCIHIFYRVYPQLPPVLTETGSDLQRISNHCRVVFEGGR